ERIGRILAVQGEHRVQHVLRLRVLGHDVVQGLGQVLGRRTGRGVLALRLPREILAVVLTALLQPGTTPLRLLLRRHPPLPVPPWPPWRWLPPCPRAYACPSGTLPAPSTPPWPPVRSTVHSARPTSGRTWAARRRWVRTRRTSWGCVTCTVT